MYQSNLSQRSLRSALLLGAASIVAVGMAAPAAADTVETVVVTGSLIPTPNATSNSPIQTVGAEAIDLSGHANVEQLLNNLPQIVPSFGSTSNNPGGGQSNIDLRGLAPNRNLVLVDGRRAMTSSTTGEVDINTIPASLIDHVDIVSGGGASTYGSDAISGVVNFVLKKDFEGFQAQVRYGQEIQHSWAPEKSANMILGLNTADGKGNITAYAEYYKRDGVLESENFRFAIDMGNGGNQGGSAFTDQGRLDPTDGFLPPLPKGGTGACAGASVTYTFKANGDPEGFCNRVAPIPTDPRANAVYNSIVGALSGRVLNTQGDRFNFAPFNYFVIPARRFAFDVEGHYDIFPGIELYTALKAVDSAAVTNLAPTPVGPQPFFDFSVFPKAACAGKGTMPGNGVAGCDPLLPGFYFNPSSPGGIGTTAYVNPNLQAQFDARALAGGGYGPILARWRSAQLGPRAQHTDNHEYQMTFGLKGQFGSFFGGWDWDAYYDYGSTDFVVRGDHNVTNSRLRAGMMGCPPGSPSSGGAQCVPIDIFGANNLSQAQVNYLDYTTTDRIQYDRHIAHAETHGDLFDLPAGPVSVALGAEYRKDTAAFTPDQEKRSFDIQGFPGAAATKGTFNVSEVFGEVRVPVLSDMDFAEYLGFDGGYRYSNYSTSGSLSTWKAGAEYQPIDDLRFRVMWQRSARAPNVSELFNGGAQGFPSFADPCDSVNTTGAGPGSGTAIAIACHAQFEAAGAHGAETLSYQPSNGQYQSVGFGNGSLGPEKANTFTAGVVITPSFLDGVTASVDYYHIAINNFIGGAFGGTSGVASTCIASIEAGNPIPPFLFIPDPTNPAHTTATFANACQYSTRLANGDAIYAVPNENIAGTVKTGGLDIQVNAQHDLADLIGESDDWGTLDASIAVSLLTQFFDPFGAANCGSNSLKGTVDYCGTTTFGTADIRPNIRWTSSFGYTFGDWRAQLSWTHFGHVNDPFSPTGATGLVVPAYNHFDLTVRWNFAENYSAQLVVDNLFDKQPPLGFYTLEGGINTLNNSYDVQGRRASIALTAKL